MWSALAAKLSVSGTSAGTLALEASDGTSLPLRVGRWCAAVTPAERGLLSRVVPPVLDIGCGPGRVGAYLAAGRVPTLGVDIAEEAAAIARRRGGAVLCRCVFDPLPAEGTWGTAVLLDGNVGIGGDPQRLLERVRALVAVGGRVLVEVDSPGAMSGRFGVRLAGFEDWEPWARVRVDDLAALATRAGFELTDCWTREGRWFAQLDD